MKISVADVNIQLSLTRNCLLFVKMLFHQKSWFPELSRIFRCWNCPCEIFHPLGQHKASGSRPRVKLFLERACGSVSRWHTSPSDPSFQLNVQFCWDCSADALSCCTPETHSHPFTPGLCPRSPGLGSVGAFAPIATNLLQEKGLEHCFECDLWDQMEWFRVSFYLLVMYHWANYLISLSLSFFHYLGQHYQLGWLQGWLWCL